MGYENLNGETITKRTIEMAANKIATSWWIIITAQQNAHLHCVLSTLRSPEKAVIVDFMQDKHLLGRNYIASVHSSIILHQRSYPSTLGITSCKRAWLQRHSARNYHWGRSLRKEPDIWICHEGVCAAVTYAQLLNQTSVMARCFNWQTHLSLWIHPT